MDPVPDFVPDRERSPGTLGEVLYARPSEALVSEAEWVALVRFVAAGDQSALHALYERAHRAVFTLIMRMTANRETAEEVTLDVFHDVWRRASRYQEWDGTVLGWIMNQARSRAIDRIRFDQRKKRVNRDGTDPLPAADTADPGDLIAFKQQSQALRRAPGCPHDRRAAGDRGGILHRVDVCRSGGAVEPACRNDQDANSLGVAQASRCAGRGRTPAVSAPLHDNPCDQSAQVSAYLLQALTPDEAAAVETHLASCPQCRQDLETLRPVADSFVFWPTDVLRPPASLRKRLAHRIAAETGENPVLPPSSPWKEPAWEEVAPGIFCKLMATDTERHRVSMLVRLLPGVEYPPHTHAGLEELFLLDGELWINDRKLYPGDYNRAEAGSGDKRVWSETGCTCVLVTRYSGHSRILSAAASTQVDATAPPDSLIH